MQLNRTSEIADFTGRTLEGRAYRYESPSRVTDDGWVTSYYEEIVAGADTRTLKNNTEFPVYRQHDRTVEPLGQVTFALSDLEKSLMFTATLNRNADADEILANMADWQDVSVSFSPIRSSERTTKHHGTIIQRAEIRLFELSLAATGTGLAKGAEVTHVRSAHIETPRLVALRKKLILL